MQKNAGCIQTSGILLIGKRKMIEAQSRGCRLQRFKELLLGPGF